MSVFEVRLLKCVCGNEIEMPVAQSVNVRRSPDARARILSGEAHRLICPVCSRQSTIETPFYYSDPDRNALFKVCPRGERHRWGQMSDLLDAAASKIPSSFADPGKRTLRVVFGMDELREKLICQDHGIDDRDLELLKVLLVYEHPILLRRPRLRLTLSHATPDDLEFTAFYEHDAKQFRLQMPRTIVSKVTEEPSVLRAWGNSALAVDPYKLPDHWVNLWRWSTQPSALNALRTYAASVEASVPIDTTSAAFRQMLQGLPRGSHLPAWAKRDLRTLFEYAKKEHLPQLEDQLFEIRFGFALEDDWSRNEEPDDIDTLWKLLKSLPETHVEGNTKIHEIQLGVDESGGLYDPQTHDIIIGSHELPNQDNFENVVRHEVGHAVHEMKDDVVSEWLTQKFGWRVFDAKEDEGIDQWVSLMGGWGDLTESERGDVRRTLVETLGTKSSWLPNDIPKLPPGHPWNAEGFGPRLALEKTGPYWYLNCAKWHRYAGRAFFLNYWYRALMVVDAAALDIVAQMPSRYAAMSHYEFFAELYAICFDSGSPYLGVVPDGVREWMDTLVQAPEVVAVALATPDPKHEWETISRPVKKSE